MTGPIQAFHDIGNRRRKLHLTYRGPNDSTRELSSLIPHDIVINALERFLKPENASVPGPGLPWSFELGMSIADHGEQ